MSDNNEKYQDTLNDGQYIYLLQEREFRKTKEKIYKLGKTKQQHNKRFNQYPKGSLLLYQIICDDCDKIERILINLFNEKFKKIEEIGNEYFEGDYKYMIDLINNTVNEKETKLETKLETVFKIQKWWRDIIYKNIKNEFPNYKEQLLGNKILFKPVFDEEYLYIKYIDFNEYDCEEISTYEKKWSEKYFNKLKTILKSDKIYNINDKTLIKKLEKSKRQFNIKLHWSFEPFHPNYEFLDECYKFIYTYLCNDTIVNNNLHCLYIKKYDRKKGIHYDEYNGCIHTDKYNGDKGYVHFVELNKNIYDTLYIRLYVPYLLCINSDKKMFYCVDRNRNVIEDDNYLKYKVPKNGFSMPWINHPFKEKTGYNDYPLYNDGSKPHSGENMLKIKKNLIN